MQRNAREIERILDYLLFQIAACCNNRFTKLSVSNCESYIDLSQSIGATLSCQDFFQQRFGPRTTDLVNQPTN